MTPPFFHYSHAGGQRERQPHPWKPLAVLLCAGLAAHGLILFDDSLFSDDWCMFFPDYTTPGLTSTYDYVIALSRPFGAWFYKITALTGLSLFGFRLLALACVVTSGLVTYGLARHFFPRQSAAPLLIALFFLIYPGSKVLHWVSTIIYTWSYALFLVGIFLLFMEPSDQRSRIVLRVCAFFLLFISFETRSLLVFYYFFILFLAYREIASRTRVRNGRASLFAYYGFCMIFPFTYWITMDAFFPKAPAFEQYNTLVSLPNIVSCYVHFCYTILKQFSHAFLVWFHHDLLAILVFLLLGAWAVSRDAKLPRVNSSVPLRTAVLVALALLVMAVTPYAVVGRDPNMNDFYSRHLLLVNMPLAVLLTLLLSACLNDERNCLTPATAVFLTAFAASFLVYGVSNQIRVEVNWIKNLGLAQAIQKSVDTDHYTYFHVDIFDDTTEYTLYPQRIYEFSGLFRMAWGKKGKVGSVRINPVGRTPSMQRLAEHEAIRKRLALGQQAKHARFFMLDGLNVDGPSVYLSAHCASRANNLEVFLRYWGLKWGSRDKLNAWLGDLWSIIQQEPTDL